jgi:hypothetical protein
VLPKRPPHADKSQKILSYTLRTLASSATIGKHNPMFAAAGSTSFVQSPYYGNREAMVGCSSLLNMYVLQC